MAKHKSATQVSFNKMPLEITFKLRVSPTLTIPPTTLDHAIFNEMIQFSILHDSNIKKFLIE